MWTGLVYVDKQDFCPSKQATDFLERKSKNACLVLHVDYSVQDGGRTGSQWYILFSIN